MYNREYESLKRINVLKDRNYYVPFNIESLPQNTEIPEKLLKYGILDRSKSERFISLDGEWQIKENNSLLETELCEKLTETINVPSCVQMFGYDNIQYLNARYPFPFNPPFVPNKNHTYHYRRTFNAQKNGEKLYLNFEGVDSGFYVYINAKFVGYSQISHATSEFDVTEFVGNGENTIDVIVLKWCASSYLECQDKFRFTGIFRSVYLLKRPINHIENYFITTKIDGANGIINIKNESLIAFSYKILNFSGKVAPNETASVNIENAKFWSAETPNLYTLILTANDEVIFEKVGIRESKIENGIYTLNGKPIKLHGVNRHDFNCKTGATVTVKNFIEDFEIMKAHNIDAIRTSHYPNIPEFYNLADEYGFYIMNEADVETHGANAYLGGYDSKLWQDFANNGIFDSGVFDREKTLLERDKNRPSVIIWSLGNESSYGKMFFEGLKYIKSRDERPVHYEGLWSTEENYYTAGIDMASRMYPSTEFVEKEFLADTKETRPLVLCEYSHSMGNSNGDLADYWREIDKNLRYIGAFVWEWADHAILTEKGFKYGGDFGETANDGNFCVDGLITPDRKIKSNIEEVKIAYSPIEIVYNNGNITVKSKYFFKNIDEKLSVKIKDNGEVLYETEINLLLKPQETQNFKVEKFVAKKYLAIYYSVGNLYYGFTELERKPTILPLASGGEQIKIAVDAVNGKIKISDYLLKITYERAYTDNERTERIGLENLGIFYAETYITETKMLGDTYFIKGYVGSRCVAPYFWFSLNLTAYNNAVKIEFNYEISEYISYLSRVGFEIELDEKNAKFEYLGYGKNESYIDKHLSAVKDVFCSTAEENYFHYIKPQETGSHYLSEYVELSSFVVDAEKPFSFSVLPYSSEELLIAKHDYELKKSKKSYLNVDIAMSGIGTSSCGEPLLKKYRISNKSGNVFFIRLKK